MQAKTAGSEKASPARFDAASAADLAALAVRAGLDRLSGALARAAAAFVGVRAWTVFGFARLDDLARERFGRSGRWLRDLAVLGEALAACPSLAAALTGSDGGRPLGRVAAILVARAIAGRPGPPGTEDGSPTAEQSPSAEEWIARARGLSVRDLRDAIARQSTAAASTAEAETGEAATATADEKGEAAAATADAARGEAAPTRAADDEDPDADRVLLRLPVPLPVLAAFEEALDLHRAIEGRSTTVTSFVESLVGEAQSGGLDSAPGLLAPLAHGVPEAAVESALRHASRGWAALPAPLAVAEASGDEVAEARGDEVAEARGDEVAEASASLGVFTTLEQVAGRGDAVELERQIRSLIHLENELETRLGQLLASMAERRDWTRLCFAGIGHYAEERLGMSRSRAGERARLARALRPLPAVAAACVSGRISMEAAALIHRMLGDEPVGPDIEAAWVEHASSATLKRMRDEARAAGRYRARAWSSGLAAGLGTTAQAAPRPLSDERWSVSLRRAPGTAIRRILEFGLRAAGLSNPRTPAPEVFHPTRPDAAPEVFHPSRPDAAPEVLQADAAATMPEVFHPSQEGAAPEFRALIHEADVFLRLRVPADLAADFLAVVEAARDATEARAASVPWDEPWPTVVAEPPAPAFLAEPHAPALAEPPSAWAARIAFVRGRRAPMWVGLLAILEDFAVTWDTDAAAPDRRDDTVFVRDGWRCAAPGCSSRRNLEIHHVVYRSRGGADDGWNLVTLCRFHHQRGEHGGLLTVRGRAPTELTWRLGRPDVATIYRAERRDSA